MSTDEDSLGSPLLPSTPTPPPQLPVERTGKSGRHIPDLLRHQHSFEARYSSLIQKQIWENSINKDVLERQLNAYFPFSRSASLNKETADGFNQMKLSAATAAVAAASSSSSSPSTSAPGSSLKTKSSVGTTSKKRLEKMDRKCLEKLETIDVADQEVQAKKKSL
ncbi:uncharacterized protein Dwil_GK15967 [Drosophila willistoni]|uniref:Uncharacterized protein n=1 Tax=Drosophila willistoni TaxID=7260 RepID=B4MS91_DROWI|nr:uncharacterized protein LOC6640821 [Drosophila willistoni]EDW74980.1 uncharacterized protein Dwil_GK15967 [Drosophila willistoni]